MSEQPRATIDVSHLPEVTFGPKETTWWGTLAFMVIEGSSLAVCATSYLYLRKNFPSWPPEHVPLPDVLVATVNALLLLVIIVPMALADRAAKRLDLHASRRWLAVSVALTALAVVLRIWEFRALNVSWEQNAYGSAAWATLGFHSALLGIDLLETLAMTVMLYTAPVEEKHFTDVSDAAFYQYFLSLSYVPLYVLLFLSPRWI